MIKFMQPGCAQEWGEEVINRLACAR